jgi:Tfp pilus assembly protein PilO
MNNTRIWTIGAIVLVFVMLIAGYELGISPTLTAITAANVQATTIQSGNAASQSKLASLQVQFKGLSKFKKALTKLRVSIPEDEDASNFLNEIAALCAIYNVSLTSVTLGGATAYVDPNAAATTPAAGASTDSQTPAPAATAATTTTTTTTTGTNGLVLIPVSVVVSGAFDSVRDFMDATQDGPRLLYAATADLSTGSDGTTTGTLTGDIFVLQGTSDAVTAPKATTLPTSTATPTATATPTPTAKATTSSTKSGSTNTTPSTAPTTSPTTVPTPDPTPTS